MGGHFWFYWFINPSLNFIVRLIRNRQLDTIFKWADTLWVHVFHTASGQFAKTQRKTILQKVCCVRVNQKCAKHPEVSKCFIDVLKFRMTAKMAVSTHSFKNSSRSCLTKISECNMSSKGIFSCTRNDVTMRGDENEKRKKNGYTNEKHQLFGQPPRVSLMRFAVGKRWDRRKKRSERKNGEWNAPKKPHSCTKIESEDNIDREGWGWAILKNGAIVEAH